MTNRSPIQDARTLRQRQTKAEALLWAVIRGKQVCQLKFRRQHPEPPYVLDFACVQARLGVELDGEYHESQVQKDAAREEFLKSKGWDVIRFSNEEVLADPESVAIAIARRLGLNYEFRKRSGGASSVLTRQRMRLEKRIRSPK